MSLFAKVKKGTKAKQETDSLGGSRLFDSGVVDFTIEVAFISVSAGGAMALNAHCKEVGGAVHYVYKSGFIQAMLKAIKILTKKMVMNFSYQVGKQLTVSRN